MAVNPSTPVKTLIELLSSQQENGVDGMRLSLHWTLVERLEVSKYPYHWCAVTGHIPLALYLYQRRHQNQKQIVIATLSSGGVNGQAPWQKAVDATPADIARMAGHARLGDVLQHMEQGIPLTWRPALHHMYPPAAREEVRGSVDALCSSGWFIHLPGPARQRILQSLVSSTFQEKVWGMVQEAEWEVARKGDFGDQLLRDVGRLLKDNGDHQPSELPPHPLRPAAGAGAPAVAGQPQDDMQQILAQEEAALNEPLRQFQFRMAYVAQGHVAGVAIPGAPHVLQSRKSRFWRLVAGSVIPLLALAVTARECRQMRRDQVAVYLAGTLAGLQLPGLLLVMAQVLGGQ